MKKFSHKKSQGRHAPSQKSESGFSPRNGSFLLYGRHSVEAALNNSQREKLCLYGTEAEIARLRDLGLINSSLRTHKSTNDELAQLVRSDAHHQGIVLEVRPLPGKAIEDLKQVDGQKNIVLVLDQVTDPHNVGAILRSAAAFDARAIITTDRNAPMETGALAKSASGALDIVPWIRVPNLARSLDQLADMGFWRVGLDGSADKHLSEIDAGDNVALILGAEGAGMREGTIKHCDFIAKLPISNKIESLNVSNAAAIALYELTT